MGSVLNQEALAWIFREQVTKDFRGKFKHTAGGGGGGGTLIFSCIDMVIFWVQNFDFRNFGGVFRKLNIIGV